ncbi:DUF2125 domain-containing protein [Hyphococcus formosus]|uniref:DUF2125 domain-containing protein n=1 Tax=Hyphococcus formosus TaxID=3143534 RepID=UPI00398B016B
MTEATKKLRRRWLYVPYAVAGIIVIAYYFLWQAGASEMKKAIGNWAADQREIGIDVQYDALKSDGFPFFLRVHVENPKIITQGGEISWYTERLSLDALPYDLNKLIFSSRTEQVTFIDGFGEWRTTAEDFRFSIANDKDHGWKFAATINSLRANRPQDNQTVELETLLLGLMPETEGGSTLVLSMKLEELTKLHGQERIDLANMRALIALTQTDLLDDQALWRENGGALVISGLEAQIEQSKLAVAGQITLDENNAPAGQLNTEITAPAAMIKAIEKLDLLSKDDAEQLSASLTLAAIAGGGKISSPIELENGAASIAGTKIADLPRFK